VCNKYAISIFALSLLCRGVWNNSNLQSGLANAQLKREGEKEIRNAQNTTHRSIRKKVCSSVFANNFDK